MNIRNIQLVADFAKTHAKAAKPLKRWQDVAAIAQWKSFADVRAEFPSVDMVKPHRLIFNIGGNNYRLIVAAYFADGELMITGVYTHADYDKLNFRQKP